VTDRRTDGQTLYRVCITCSAVKKQNTCSVESCWHCSDETVHYKDNETVNFCGFRCATASPITVFHELFVHLFLITLRPPNFYNLSPCALHSQVVVGPLEQRGFTVDAVDIFAESSNTLLSLSTECADLAGSVVYVCRMFVCPSVCLSLCI